MMTSLAALIASLILASAAGAQTPSRPSPTMPSTPGSTMPNMSGSTVPGTPGSTAPGASSPNPADPTRNPSYPCLPGQARQGGSALCTPIPPGAPGSAIPTPPTKTK
ncbi:MAG TPA: hypothetical protein VJX92_03720 [Methylomirabilota bacterium]|nr:hypothetical protein [Methylomirabilota bacterium]